MDLVNKKKELEDFLLKDLRKKYISGSRKYKNGKYDRGFKTDMLKKTNLIRTMYNFIVKKRMLYCH